MPDAADRDEQRVERILTRVKAEAGLRDMLVFGLGRIWLVLLELFALAYRALSRRTTATRPLRFYASRPGKIDS